MHYTRMAALVAALVLPALVLADLPAGWKTKHADKGKWVVGTTAVETTVLGKDPKAADKPARIVQKLVAKEGGSDLVNVQPGSDLISEHKYADCTVEVEFMIPKGSNSGVYLMGEYEVQIIDSFGKPDDKLGPGDMGGIYTAA